MAKTEKVSHLSKNEGRWILIANCDSSVRHPDFCSWWARHCWVGWHCDILTWSVFCFLLVFEGRSFCAHTTKVKANFSSLKSNVWCRYLVFPPLFLRLFFFFFFLFYCRFLPCVYWLLWWRWVSGPGACFFVWCWYLSWPAARARIPNEHRDRLFLRQSLPSLRSSRTAARRPS